MIAVFVKNGRHFREFTFLPEEQFLEVVDVASIDGRRFTGVMLGYNWWERSRDITQAMDYLSAAQPELFTKK